MPNCTGDYIEWIDKYLGECVETDRDLAGFIVGLLPTVIWIFAQLPQIILNFKNRSAEAISLVYYFFVITGDISNMVGLWMNRALVTQKVLAIWGIFADITVMLQYVVFHWVVPWFTGVPCIDPGADDVDIPKAPILPLLMAATVSISDNPYDKDNILGSILGWYSGLTFVVGRIPQAYKNYKRKRTTGLSIIFWISSASANILYGLTLFIKDSSWKYVWAQMPWIFGAWGCLPVDFTIIGQFIYYRWLNKKRTGASYTDIDSTSIESFQYQ